MQNRRFTVPLFRIALVVILGLPVAAGQSDGCPPISQLPNNTGMANDAKVQVYLYDTDAASWDNSTDPNSESNQVLNGITPWTSMAGSNQSVDVSSGNNIPSSPQTPSETLDPDELEARGTANVPVVVMEWVTPSQAASICVRSDGSTAPACTVPQTDSNNVATGAIVYMSTDIKNRTLPPEYYQNGNSGSIANFSSHEVGGHDDMGWNDFPAGTPNEQNSAMGSGAYTSVGPKPCDTAKAQQCGR